MDEPIFEDPRHDHHDTETPDPVQARIPSRPGIKHPVRDPLNGHGQGGPNLYSPRGGYEGGPVAGVFNRS